MAEQALAGLNIVVTRPREQARGLMQSIERLGGKALSFPLLEIEPVQDVQALHEQFVRLAQTDILIFISPNAVRFGMAVIEAVGGLPSNVQIATVGQGSARALREMGMARVIAPTERFDSEGLLALPELQDVAGKQVMILRGDGGRELLGDTLKARGAEVEYVTCYLRRMHELDVAQLLATAPHALTVTSSEALAYLWEKAKATPLLALPLFVPHPRIAELARQQGWKQVIVTASGDDGLIASLIAWADKGIR